MEEESEDECLSTVCITVVNMDGIYKGREIIRIDVVEVFQDMLSSYSSLYIRVVNATSVTYHIHLA